MSKTAFITGGSRGIGKACVEKFASEGFSVAFTYRDSEDAAFKLKDELEQRLGVSEKILAIKLDLSEKDLSDNISRAVDAARTYFGVSGFDAAVLNAGISLSGILTDMKDSEIDELIDVNLRAQIFTAKAVIPGMVAAKRGSIVMLSSMWGTKGASCESVYSATKAALNGFGKSLAKELGPSGIRVNMVAPGLIDTDMNKGYSDEEINEIIDGTSLKRIGTPQDVANSVYYLTSEEAAYITGQVLEVDGGIIA